MASKPATAVKAALKADSRCQYVAEVDGTAWLGTSFWCMEISQHNARSGARELLSASNLDTTPTRLSVNGTVTRDSSQDVPNLSSIVNQKRGEVVDYVHVVKRPAIVSLGEYDAYLFGTLEEPSAVRRSFVDMMVAECGPAVEFRQVSPLKPLHVVGTNGRGLIMPTRLS